MKYVFEVKVNPGYRIEDYVQAWLAESEIIQREPGARGTKLHRCIGQPDRVVAIASWESKCLRDEALDRLKDDPEINAIRKSHAKMVTFHLIGELEDPEWTVFPEG